LNDDAALTQLDMEDYQHMEEYNSPFQCHIFLCTHDRKGEEKSCADGNSPTVRKKLKKEIKNHGWLSKVRVS
jgi:hypothetical protein